MSDPLSAASLLKRPESLELYNKLVPDDGSVDRLTAACWKYLLLCMETPRPSSQLAAITERLSSLAPLLGCQADLDPVGNLRFRKNPSSDAKANVPGICMQGHMDMVTTANSDTVFDFEKSPIDAFIENGWLKARGTTLGADNGVGLAGGLAVLEFAGKEGALAEHGLLELLCTVDEETTMIGAEKLAPHPFLQSSILLNLDSEEEYSICIGCAGGAEYSNEIDVEQVPVLEGTSFLQISISGLFGGHSGVDIHKGKGNAIKILARTLLTTIEKVPFQIVSLNGGGACNVIPRESFAIVAIESGKVDALKQELQEQFEKVQKVYIAVEHKEIVEGQKRESNIKLTLTDGIESAPASIASSQSTQKIIDWLANFPDGVLRFNYDVKDLTETSINLCRTEFSSPATLFVSRSFARSSSSVQLDFVFQQLKGLSRLAGARISEPENAFPGWDPDVTSKPLAILTDDHKKLFDREPHVYAIHAGLECGLIQAVYPSMICISIGPQIENAHSPDERLSIASLDLFMRLTGKFVASIASHY